MKVKYETERLVIREWEEKDYMGLYEFASDVEITKFLHYNTYSNAQEAKARISKIIDSYKLNPLINNFAVVLKLNNKVIGDINISSYIPDSYIENSSQKIEVYQNIALCRTEEDIQNVIDELIDRYGVMPKELENLIEVARIKEMCRKAGIVKISEKKNMLDIQSTQKSIVFYFDKNKYNPEIVDGLIKKYGYNIKFSTGVEPYITLKIENITGEELIEMIKGFLTEI